MADPIQWCVEHKSEVLEGRPEVCEYAFNYATPAEPCNIKDAWVVMDDEMPAYLMEPAEKAMARWPIAKGRLDG